MSNKRNIKIFGIMFLVLLVVVSFWLYSELDYGKLKVYFLDVGQGDSILIKTPSNHQILIDGGPDNKVIQRLSKHMMFFDRTIDMVVLTHPEKDHISGLIDVLKRYKVNTILETGMNCETFECNEWENIKKQKNIQSMYAQIGEKFDFGDGAEINILHPFESIHNVELKDKNLGSIVIKLIYGNTSMLFTGDIEQLVEKKLLSAGLDISADVLKIAHHGSKTSSSEDFLKLVDPIFSFIEVGQNNRYGHPSSEVLLRLQEIGTQILRTDEKGDVTVECSKSRCFID